MLRIMAGPATNPFQPGRGVPPPLLAGRDEELARAEERLADLAEGRSPAEDLLFYGPRGNGKTSLLLEIERRARSRDYRVAGLPAEALADREELVEELRLRAGESRSRFTGGQLLGVGLTATAGTPSRNIAKMFADWAAADPTRPLVVLLDEAQSLDPQAARPFFSAVQTAKSRAAPFLVLAAGTPDAPRRVLRSGTFNERGFEFLPVGRLERPHTNAALSEPARESGRPISEEALARLAEESQDYPYFVQLLGSAAWKAAAQADSAIDAAATERAVSEFAARLEPFYSRRYRDAESRRLDPVLRPLASLVAKHGGTLTDGQLMPLLRGFDDDPSIPFDDLSLRDELSDLGVLWETRDGVWEMGIPSFADYLLRRP